MAAAPSVRPVLFDTRIAVAPTIVRGACPHDCPDTCALKITVEAGRVTKVQGDPDHPPTHGALCTKVSRYAERTYHDERVLTPLKRVGAKGRRPVRRRELGRGLDGHRGAPAGHRGARSRSHPALQLRRHHGLAARREHGSALFSPARRLQAGSNHLLQRWCGSPHCHLWRQGRYAPGGLCRQPVDRDLGQQFDRLEPAFLDLCAAGQTRRRQAGVHRSAPHRNRRQMPPAHCPAAGQ